MSSLGGLALLSLSLLSPALAQDDEIVWGAVIITSFGDRIPLLSPQYSELTSYGAQQMNSLGSAFRNRYIENGSSDNGMNRTIQGISRDALDNLQTSITTMYDIFVQQSTSAFMTGLYPPLNSSSNSTAPDRDVLYNSTFTPGPLSNLQYPQLYTASFLDPNYIYLNASASCLNFQSSYSTYLSSAQYSTLSNSTGPALESLSSAITSALPHTPLTAANAYLLYDYLRYTQLHSSDPTAHITPAALAQTRATASALYQEIYGNTTADSGIRAIGGAGLASFIGTSLLSNTQTNGTQYKLSIASTGDESLVSLFALLGVADLHEEFLGLPELGSAAGFEMYSLSSAALVGVDAFPSEDDLRVRFLLKNGTEEIGSFSVLGRGERDADWGLGEFLSKLGSVVGASGPGEWCERCGGGGVFCGWYTEGEVGVPGNEDGVEGSRGLSPVVAGVIGAMVTLGVVGLVLIAVMILFGVRFARSGRGVVGGGFGRRKEATAAGGSGASAGAGHKRKSSGLGGFKGAEKLASDIDLPKGGSGGFGATVTPTEEGGHRRVESWELREGRGRVEEQQDDIKAVDSREHV
ncbi:MAG: hypothetical protein MMC23_008329 [Stictis urceolatum]|nr:hypothetical protein [Stictis urceolata]